MDVYFDTVETALSNNPSVAYIANRGVEEVNATLSMGESGGNFVKTFVVSLTPEPDPWKLDSAAATLERELMDALGSVLGTSSDGSKRVLFVSADMRKDELLVKAHYIPDPQ